MSDQLEIERKFLVPEAPTGLEGWPHTEIEQGYLCCDQQHEVRLRHKADRYLQTVKSGGGLERREIEVEIERRVFEQLWPATEGRRLTKTRYQVNDGAFTLEVDVYHGHLAGLITAEVEFPSREEAERYAAPSWLGPELTDDQRFKNRSLAVHGLPEAD